MNESENKRRRLILILLLLSGGAISCAINLYSRVYQISDFVKGFFEGMGGTFLAFGVIYFVFVLLKYKKL